MSRHFRNKNDHFIIQITHIKKAKTTLVSILSLSVWGKINPKSKEFSPQVEAVIFCYIRICSYSNKECI